MAKRMNKTNENQFFKSLDGLAYGMFVSIGIGAVMIELGKIFNFNQLIAWGGAVQNLAGPAIGIGIAYATGTTGIALLSAGLAGAICVSDSAAWPICAYLAVMISCYVGQFIKDKTPIDIFLTPVITIAVAGLINCVAAPYIDWAVDWLVCQIDLAATFPVWMMSMLVSCLMGLIGITPLISLSISYTIGLNGLAAGAAIAGECAFMMGLAAMSMNDNEIGDVIATGAGMGLLQFKNAIKHPLILIPPILTSLINGPLSACLLKLSGTTYGAGIGNVAFAGPLSIVSVMGNSYWLMVIIVDMLLPIIICYSIYRAFLRLGWIRAGDLKIRRL